MADWDKFWKLINEAISDEVILQDSNVFGDYLDGQYVVQRANQICRECGLSWYLDWNSTRVRYLGDLPGQTFVKEMTGDVVVTDGGHEERRPACGLGTAFNKEDIKVKQVDTACKGTLTDLLKNGWMRFGRHLGGQLYFGKNPPLAEALGWEISKRQRQPHPHDTLPPSDLGSYTIHPGGWGKDNKFGGMSLKEVYEDPDDGYGAMSWAATLDEPRGATAKMAQYFRMREKEEEGGMSDESAAAPQLISRAQVESINVLIQNNTGEGKLFGHANHVRNHLKWHFKAAKVVDLTGEQATAFTLYIKSGGNHKDPRWYAAKIPVPHVTEPATSPSAEATARPLEELFGPESIEDLLKKAAPNLPEAWRDKPERWWKSLCGQYSLGPVLNAKQLETVHFLLEAMASGNIDLNDVDGPTHRIFVDGMKQVAGDA